MPVIVNRPYRPLADLTSRELLRRAAEYQSNGNHGALPRHNTSIAYAGGPVRAVGGEA
jgi:hypothetical protein